MFFNDFFGYQYGRGFFCSLLLPLFLCPSVLVVLGEGGILNTKTFPQYPAMETGPKEGSFRLDQKWTPRFEQIFIVIVFPVCQK